jgi:hypothetical protein
MIENITKNCSIIIDSVDCSILKYAGVYCILLIVISITTNTTLIWLLLKNRKDMLHNFNILILALAILSLFGTLFGLPTVMITTFSCM